MNCPATEIDTSVRQLPRTQPQSHPQFDLVSAAIHYLRDKQQEQPTLEELAVALDVSPSQLQRVFSAWAGVSPKRFLQILTRNQGAQALRQKASVLDASLEAGLSSPARLHDLTIACDAMTPGELASGGAGMQISHGITQSPFGPSFIAWCERGVCQLAFLSGPAQEEISAFKQDWPNANHTRDDAGAQQLTEQVFAHPLERGRLHLLLRGTNFQVKVWEALLAVGTGELASYQTLAKHAGHARASRAVGSAMAANRIAYLIPCHRVIRASGDWGSYRWGLNRKIALHAWESSVVERARHPTSA